MGNNKDYLKTFCTHYNEWRRYKAKHEIKLHFRDIKRQFEAEKSALNNGEEVDNQLFQSEIQVQRNTSIEEIEVKRKIRYNSLLE